MTIKRILDKRNHTDARALANLKGGRPPPGNGSSLPGNRRPAHRLLEGHAKADMSRQQPGELLFRIPEGTLMVTYKPGREEKLGPLPPGVVVVVVQEPGIPYPPRPSDLPRIRRYGGDGSRKAAFIGSVPDSRAALRRAQSQGSMAVRCSESHAESPGISHLSHFLMASSAARRADQDDGRRRCLVPRTRMRSKRAASGGWPRL